MSASSRPSRASVRRRSAAEPVGPAPGRAASSRSASRRNVGTSAGGGPVRAQQQRQRVHVRPRGRAAAAWRQLVGRTEAPTAGQHPQQAGEAQPHERDLEVQRQRRQPPARAVAVHRLGEHDRAARASGELQRQLRIVARARWAFCSGDASASSRTSPLPRRCSSRTAAASASLSSTRSPSVCVQAPAPALDTVLTPCSTLAPAAVGSSTVSAVPVQFGGAGKSAVSVASGSCPPISSRPPARTKASRCSPSSRSRASGSRTTTVLAGSSRAWAIGSRSSVTGCPARAASSAQAASPWASVA